MNKNLWNKIYMNQFLIEKNQIYTLFPAVAPTRHGRFPLNFPTATVRGNTLLLNCNEKTGTNI
jgi:hypothetical protein